MQNGHLNAGAEEQGKETAKEWLERLARKLGGLARNVRALARVESNESSKVIPREALVRICRKHPSPPAESRESRTKEAFPCTSQFCLSQASSSRINEISSSGQIGSQDDQTWPRRRCRDSPLICSFTCHSHRIPHCVISPRILCNLVINLTTFS